MGVGEVYVGVLLETHGGGGHAGVLAFEHARLLALDDVLVDLDGGQTHDLVEAHDGLLDVEGLGQIVVGGQRDVLVGHGLTGDHAVGHQDKLGLVVVAGLELVAQLAAGDAVAHVLLADDEVGLQGVYVGECVLDVVVDVEVVNLAQVQAHELQEVAVGVDEDYAELLGQSLYAQRLDVECQLLAGLGGQVNLALLVELQAVLGGRLGFLLRILQRALHLGDARDDL